MHDWQPFLSRFLFFCLRTGWPCDLSWFSVKDMASVHHFWELFASLLCHLHFLDSLKESADMKLRKHSFLSSQLHLFKLAVMPLSYFTSHKRVRIQLSSKNCYFSLKRENFHAPQLLLEDPVTSPSLSFNFQIHVSYSKCISLTGTNCCHIFTFYYLKDISQGKLHLTSMLFFTHCKDYRKKVHIFWSRLQWCAETKAAICCISDEGQAFYIQAAAVDTCSCISCAVSDLGSSKQRRLMNTATWSTFSFWHPLMHDQSPLTSGRLKCFY